MPKQKEDPEFLFQFFPLKITAKGIEAVRPIAWAVGLLVLCYAISLIWK
jgi:hypothetical protein